MNATITIKLDDIDEAVVAEVRADLIDSHGNALIPESLYSEEQVREALFKYWDAQIEELRETLGEKFMDLPVRRQERYLGAPQPRETELIPHGKS